MGLTTTFFRDKCILILWMSVVGRQTQLQRVLLDVYEISLLSGNQLIRYQE